jgi:hypothetical protein
MVRSARGYHPNMNSEKNFPAPVVESSDAKVKQSPIERAKSEVKRLNAQIESEAEARREFVEATK